MSTPLVSFVVPCYKLAHYLANCIDSILGQTHPNVEVIVMDDNSPDDTGAVVARYAQDARVRYVRNDPNLGHLRNYNKGIGLARGDYIWLISADDCLRARDAVERYVKVLEANPRVTFAFCPALELTSDGEARDVVGWTRPFESDAVIESAKFLRLLADGNCVSAPSVLVRRTAYETCGAFPLDLPHAGDWYLWCAFAAAGDVAYVAEPLIFYRTHGGQMSVNLHDQKMALVRADQDRVRWRLKEMADRAGATAAAQACLDYLALRTAIDLVSRTPVPGPDDLRREIDALPENHLASAERPQYFASVVRQAADQLYGAGKLDAAQMYYRAALSGDPSRHSLRAKLMLARLGPAGAVLRRAFAGLRSRKAAG